MHMVIQHAKTLLEMTGAIANGEGFHYAGKGGLADVANPYHALLENMRLRRE